MAIWKSPGNIPTRDCLLILQNSPKHGTERPPYKTANCHCKNSHLRTDERDQVPVLLSVGDKWVKKRSELNGIAGTNCKKAVLKT